MIVSIDASRLFDLLFTDLEALMLWRTRASRQATSGRFARLRISISAVARRGIAIDGTTLTLMCFDFCGKGVWQLSLFCVAAAIAGDPHPPG